MEEMEQLENNDALYQNCKLYIKFRISSLKLKLVYIFKDFKSFLTESKIILENMWFDSMSDKIINNF